ncbi:MAG: CBS domain-containing protein [Candidatus Kapabacteria bacterium]|nr:CBS domain-containing protein [Candidatus Kapabacteria bacterium]
MDLIFSIIFFFVGCFIAFIASSLSSINYDEINETDIQETNHNDVSFLQNVFFEYSTGIFIWEIFFYAISFSFISHTLFLNGLSLIDFILIIVAFLIVTFIFRSSFSALGKRQTIKSLLKFIGFVKFLRIISYPFTAFEEFLMKLITGKTEQEASREELTAMVESARQEGTLDDEEYRILKNIMHFSDVLVSDVMTPRTVVFSCNATKTVGEIVNLPEMQMYSRIPIWDGNSLDDGVIGYVMSKDVYYAALTGKNDLPLKKLIREIDVIPENAQLDMALNRFLKKRQHIFLVVDEYGGIEGIITMEDVLETILGVEIVDEADRIVDLRELAKLHRDKRIAQNVTFSDK